MEAAAICDGALTALPFIRDVGNLQPGHHILINGASGAVGSYGVQLAKHFGAKVTAVCSTSKMDMVKYLGADTIIDYMKDDFTKLPPSFDVVFDAVGKSSFGKCANLLKRDGIYMSTVPTMGIMIQMMWTSKFGQKKAKFLATGLQKDEQRIADLHYLRTLVEVGIVKAVIDKSYPVDEIVQAHTYVDTGRKKGNVVIELKD